MKYYFYPLKERYSGDNCTKYKIKHLGGEAEARSSVDTNLPSSVMPGYLPFLRSVEAIIMIIIATIMRMMMMCEQPPWLAMVHFKESCYRNASRET